MQKCKIVLRVTRKMVLNGYVFNYSSSNEINYVTKF